MQRICTLYSKSATTASKRVNLIGKMMEKMKLQTLDISHENIARLRELFPECVAEVKDKDGSIRLAVDFEQLKSTLGESAESGKERFGLNWPGKAECMRIIQQPSIATLKPDREESVNFDQTENLFIEGDNLEALKLLQKSYFGKVKMIYIDPPYNTGKEFIYPDKYTETLDTYLEYTGQKDSEGRRFSTNTDTQGRYHSNWLNMMYPRLYIAKNLLREDGVIFISIDDNEVSHLRELCNFIFGEENFEGHIHWRRRYNQPNDPTKMLAIVAEHILVYSKDQQFLKTQGVGKIALTGNFKNPDNDPRGPWASKPWKAGSDQSGSRYVIETPTGKKHNEEWMGDQDTFTRLLKDNRIIFLNKNNSAPRKKYYENERTQEGQCATNWWPDNIFGHNPEGNKETEMIFEIKNIFSNPKPTRLVKQIITLSNAQDDDLLLDFFAGSATTAHAVMQLNAEDGGNRKYIMVQLPEPTDEKSEAYKAGYKTIADIGKERIRRAAKKIQEKNPDYQGELGFKVFKLSQSNFKVWEGNVDKIDDLQKQLQLHINHINPDSSSEDILYEILLKSGFPLTAKIEKIRLARKDVFSIEDGAMMICLDKKINRAVIDAIAKTNPLQVIFLDEGFKGNDQLKANAVQTFKSLAQAKESEIVFRTV